MPTFLNLLSVKYFTHIFEIKKQIYTDDNTNPNPKHSIAASIKSRTVIEGQKSMRKTFSDLRMMEYGTKLSNQFCTFAEIFVQIFKVGINVD